MSDNTRLAGVALIVAIAGDCARGDVTYLLQDRTITATTSFDANTQSLLAPDFGPFIAGLSLLTFFPLEGGGEGRNRAEAAIDCHLDPNAILAGGSVLGEGGTSFVGGVPRREFGEAGARVNAAFRVDAATPFQLLASARPGINADDRFKIKLEDLTHGGVLFYLDETMPPQAVNFSGVLAPGDYSLEYQIEITIDGPESLAGFSLEMRVPSPGAGTAFAIAGCVTALRRRRVGLLRSLESVA